MKPVAIRLLMIVSLLVSLQTSAGMIVTVDHVAPIQASAMPHCTDMPGMSNADKHSIKSAGKHQREHCKTSCCMSFLAITTSHAVPVIKPVQDYQETTVLSPSHVTRINYRPPIFS
ncbi:MAG TPA: hypothetical protein VLB90_08010 [Pseudomonadales bacterium]|nr:hypothetical protein [Pseudomonadales bacterium]